MRVISVLLVLILSLTLFSACNTKTENSNENTTENQTSSVETTSGEDAVRIGVDKKNLADPESFIDNMKKYGAEVRDLTDAGGYLLLFSDEEHKKLLDDKKADVLKKFKDYEENQEHYVESIEYDEDFRNMKVYVNKDLYSKTGTTTGNVIVASAVLSYQMFLESGQKTNVEVIYDGTEEVVSKFTLPMNLNISQ